MQISILFRGLVLKHPSASLCVPTPDGSGQAVHPDVLHVSDGFLGYPYWMACTPYPFAQDRAENPLVRVSNDGVLWEPFPGAPDPLVAAPTDASWHHADTDLVLHQGVLYLFYISTNRHEAETTFSLITTRDGVHWTPPSVIYRDEWGVSPAAVVTESGQWQLWYVWRDSLSRAQTSRLYRRTSNDPCLLGPPQLCSLEIPGHVVWHLDVLNNTTSYEALVTAFPAGTDPSRSRLFHATSLDGIDFKLSTGQPLLKPSWFGWDNRMVYRSTFVKRCDGTYRVWYSAASWGMRCGIGLLEGQLSQLRPVHGANANNQLPRLKLLREDALGLAKYVVYRILPAQIYSLVLSMRDRMRTMQSGQP